MFYIISERGKKELPIYERFVAHKTTLETTGIQSFVVWGEVDGVSVIKKNSGAELSKETIDSFAGAIPEYRAKLIEAGVVIPENFSVRNHMGLELIDKKVDGVDIDVMIKMKDPKVQECWTEMVELICKLNDGTNLSRVMIDGKPSNFIKSGDKLYYVDFFPPMLRDKQGLATPWADEVYHRDRRMMTFNFGDTRGQITKLLAGSRITYPEVYEYLKTWTLEIIKDKLPEETFRYINEQVENNFPDMNLFYSGKDLTQRMDELSK